MVYQWSDLLGQSVENLYVIKAIHAEQPDRATFLASTHDDEAPVIVEILSPDSPDVDGQRRSWQIAADLQHDNLVRILHTGDTQIEGASLLYCAKELHDDELAAVLDTRSLTEDEVREVLGAVLPCLDYLHRAHYVHGSVNPSTVLAFGDRVKLAPDTIHPAGRSRTVSEDINGVGMLIMAMRTGHRGAAPDLTHMSGPLREVVTACLDTKTRQTLTPAGIMRMLNAPVEAPKPEPVSVPLPPPPASPPLAQAYSSPVHTRRSPFKLAGGVVAATLLIGVIWQSRRDPEPLPANEPVAKKQEEVRPDPVLPTEPTRQRQEEQPRVPPPAAVKTAPAKTAPAKPAAVKSAPAKPAPAATAPGSWAVIAAAYRNFEGAEKRAASLRRQWADCDCSVYPEKGQGSKYYVVVGSGLTKDAAERLRTRARSSRFPSDMYVTRLSEGATRTRQAP